MHKLIKIIPLIAIAFIVYGIIRFDWIAVLLGIILFIIGFIFHVIKNRNIKGTTSDSSTPWEVFMAEMSEDPSDVLKAVTIKTTIYYLEIEKNYRDLFKDKVLLLATAGVLDAFRYIFVDEKISISEVIDIAKASVKQDNNLADFITSLTIKIFQVYNPENALAAKHACLGEKMQTIADVKQIRERYKTDPCIVKEVKTFMESPDFSVMRNELGIR